MPEPSLTPAKPALPTVLESPVFSGPAKSERFGICLGVDLTCAESGMVVSRDVRMPRASYVITTAARHLIRQSKSGEKLDSVVVWGSEADPTMHPEFKEVTQNLRDLRAKWYSKGTLVLATDMPRVDDPEVRHAMGIYDRVVVRFEWGTAKTYAALTGRKSTDFNNLCAHLGHCENLIVQARFVRGEADNSNDAEVKAWLKKVTELKPRAVHILTGDTKSKKLKPAPKGRISEIVAEVTSKAGVPVEVFVGDSLLGTS